MKALTWHGKRDVRVDTRTRLDPRARAKLASSRRSVRPGPSDAVRDDAGARAGDGRRAVRLHEAVRERARWPGGAPPRAACRLHAHQGPRRPRRRALAEGRHRPLGVEEFATHRLPLDAAPDVYEMFQKKEDGAIKVVLKP